MAETIITAGWLFVASVLDIRSKRLPVWLLALGGAVAVLEVAGRCGFTIAECLEIVKGCIPGAVFLLLAAVTGKAGAADGMVLIFLGMCLGDRVCLGVFALSMLFISIFSGILLALRRVGRNTRLPYLPFLFAAWVLGRILFI